MIKIARCTNLPHDSETNFSNILLHALTNIQSNMISFKITKGRKQVAMINKERRYPLTHFSPTQQIKNRLMYFQIANVTSE